MDYGEFIRSKEFSAQGAGFECGSLNQSLKDYQSDILPVWPNAYKDAQPVTPSPETLSWITSRNIAYSKRRVA